MIDKSKVFGLLLPHDFERVLALLRVATASSLQSECKAKLGLVGGEGEGSVFCGMITQSTSPHMNPLSWSPSNRQRLLRKALWMFAPLLLLWLCLLYPHYLIPLPSSSSQPTCAICFWGLPRAFQDLVLPSLRANVLNENPHCDYYVHYYDLASEDQGRSGAGGTIHARDIHLLEQVVKHIQFTSDTNETFWQQYEPLVQRIRTQKDPSGENYYYYPYRAASYVYPSTTDNIIKMWHTIQASFQLLQRSGKHYDRVAMLRSDVVYLTPIRVLDERYDDEVVIPGFGRHPFSDRLIVGPMDDVQIWATERFSRLEEHVEWIYEHNPGWGLHSERFVNHTLLSRLEHPIVQDPQMCFLRARADGTVWISDCDGSPTEALPSIRQGIPNVKLAVERVLGRTCGPEVKPRGNLITVNCSKEL